MIAGSGDKRSRTGTKDFHTTDVSTALNASHYLAAVIIPRHEKWLVNSRYCASRRIAKVHRL